MAHPNEQMLRSASEAMDKGNPQPMFDMFADDAVIHVGGRNKIAGDYKGKDEIQKSFGMFMQSLGENPKMETHAILADDEHAVVLQKASASRGGKNIEIPGVGIFHFANGKVSEAWFHDMDPYSADPWYDEGLR